MMLSEKPHILSLSPDALHEIILSWGEKKFRSKQVLDWIYQKNIINFEEMSNLSKELRDQLSRNFDHLLPEVDAVVKSKDLSEKYRLRLNDGQLIEMVFMPGQALNNEDNEQKLKQKNTLCISSQVGCARNCQFCATAKIGLIRNLKTEELIAQYLLAQQLHPDQRITNIVLMGMGEPLDNFENVIQFIKLMQNDQAFSFSPRRMTLSTCGIISQIKRLSETGIKIKLAVSLNSAITEKRTLLMPVTANHPLDELKRTLLDFRKRSNFRITFEYIMIKNFNMGDEDVKALIKFAGDISCKINLIKWNHVPGLEWQSPSANEIDEFISKLSKISAAITLRQSRGDDIAAACGQLIALKES